jgi:predicted deacetylase
MAAIAPPPPRHSIAVALHGIEPATFERCALIRDWLDDHGVDRVTLLVIPARDLHPVGDRSPEMVSWLHQRRLLGDSIAQHGFQHVRSASQRAGPRRLMPAHPQRRSGEFVGLDGPETRRAVDAGWRVLKLAGIEPDGFVAPAYAYTAALRRALGLRFSWWADLLRVHAVGSSAAAGTEGAQGSQIGQLAPALRLTSPGPVGRALSPALVRAVSLLPTRALRLDLHPADLSHARHMMALEWVLSRTGRRRRAVTYRELAGG